MPICGISAKPPESYDESLFVGRMGPGLWALVQWSGAQLPIPLFTWILLEWQACLCWRDDKDLKIVIVPQKHCVVSSTHINT